jgi:hypothetical protein
MKVLVLLIAWAAPALAQLVDPKSPNLPAGFTPPDVAGRYTRSGPPHDFGSADRGVGYERLRRVLDCFGGAGLGSDSQWLATARSSTVFHLSPQSSQLSFLFLSFRGGECTAEGARVRTSCTCQGH